MQGKGKPRKLLVKDALTPLIAEESDKLIDQEADRARSGP